MTLLTFNNKYVVTSATAVTTATSSLVNDTQASQTFTLSKSQTVFAVYSAFCNHNATNAGMEYAIGVDGTDYGLCWDTGYSTNYVCRSNTFWIGTLTAGSHTVQGRFCSHPNNVTGSISERTMVVVVFDGDEFSYKDVASAVTTTSSAFIDDTGVGDITFTPSDNCYAIYLYNISNAAATEHLNGKKAAINNSLGTDVSQAEKSPRNTNLADSIFTVAYENLSAAAVTVNGRFASVTNNQTTTIDNRQFGTLLIASSSAILLAETTLSDTATSSASNTLVDDPYLTVTQSLTMPKELLVLGMATTRSGTTSNNFGSCYGLKINDVDRVKTRTGVYGSTNAGSVGLCWAETVFTDTVTVQGRISNNTGSNTAAIDSRKVYALFFPQVPGVIFSGLGTLKW